MRVLHIGKFASPEPGGIETFVRDLTRCQARMGHEVSLLAAHGRGGRGTFTRVEHGVRVTRCRSMASGLPFPASLSMLLEMFRLRRGQQPGIIHLHLPNPAVVGRLLLPGNVPLVVHWHADVAGAGLPSVRRLYPVYGLFERACLSRAAAIVATSPPYLEASPSLAPWRDKCAVVPLGLDTEQYPVLPQGSGPDRPLVLGVGRFAYYKGFEHLIRAAGQEPRADFVIVGDGPLLPDMRALVASDPALSHVRLPGRVSDAELGEWFGRASVFCLPSVDRSEAFGMVLLEAMRYGLPLVTTRIPGSGTSWVNREGVTGLVVDRASPQALARAVGELLDHPDRAAQYGRAGRKRLAEMFSIESVARSMDAIYQGVAS